MNSPNIKDDIGSWLDNAGRFPRLSAEETNLLGRKIQSLEQDDPARSRLVNKLVQHNLRLVASSVKGYLNCGPSGRKWGCSETVDFLQVGCLGLVRAAELYDPSKGYTFATYANHWIRSKVSRYAIKTRGIVHVSEAASRNIISYKKNGFLRSRKTGEVIPDKQIVPILREAEAALSAASLDAISDRGSAFVERLVGPSREAEDRDLRIDVDAALDAAGVSQTGKELLMMLHGHGMSRAEAGQALGLSRSRVRSEREEALRLARASEELAGFLR